MILSTGNYDVDAPEGAQPTGHSAFISRKDWKVMGAVVVILFFIAMPIFHEFKERRDEQVCKTSINGIYKAMMQYATLNDERLPPLYTVGENGAPYLYEGKPYVWASLVAPYMNKRDSFKCPSATPVEAMEAIGFNGSDRIDFALTYGMYVALNAVPFQLLSQQSATALLVETSNMGAEGSFDPLPFKDSSGTVVPFDAFVAGYDDSNGSLTPKSRWITRLAFRNASKGYMETGVQSRHPSGIHAIFVDGHLGKLAAPQAKVENIYPDVEGMWRVR